MSRLFWGRLQKMLNREKYALSASTVLYYSFWFRNQKSILGSGGSIREVHDENKDMGILLMYFIMNGK